MTEILYDPGLNELLARATDAYRRHDDSVFAELLHEAIRRVPHRIDLRFNLGQHYVQTFEIDKALEIFHDLARDLPQDPDALTCYAHWSRYAEGAPRGEKLRRAMGTLHPRHAKELAHLWLTLDVYRILPVTDALPRQPDDPQGEQMTVVLLGYRLNPDGSMDAQLLDRLGKTLDAANYWPAARIIVSGGVPQAGRVEAEVMRDWLMEHGVDGPRILPEGYSRDVLENCIYSRQILDQIGAQRVVVITSADAARRAGACLTVYGRASGSRWTVAGIAASPKSVYSFSESEQDRIKLWRDILRAHGVLMMRTWPGLAEI